MMKSIAVIYNLDSGSGQSGQYALQLKKFLESKGSGSPLDITLMETRNGFEAYQCAKEASTQHCDLVVAIGGDGTINKVAGGIVDGGGFSALGILPGGSVNNFARALKIPLEPSQAMENLWDGRERYVDIGKINDSYMISSMTIGLLADIAVKVSLKEKKKLGPLAYLKNSFRVLRKNRSYPLKLSFDGGVMSQKVKILLVTMTNSVGGFGHFNPEASPDDGYFYVYVLSSISLFKTILRLPYFLTGRFVDIPEVNYIKTKNLTLESRRKKRKCRTRIDGDPGDTLPVAMKVMYKNLKVIVPWGAG